MKIINKTLDKNKVDMSLIESNICFIDIETTGLSRQYNSIYLIGLLYFEDDTWKLVQIFADSLDEEEKVLRSFLNLISKFNKIITYNGDSFDIPFINYRLKKYHIQGKIYEEISMDLYKIVKNNKHYLNIENLKLKTLERYLGIFREDIYNGKDCIEFYLEYTRTKDYELEERVLKHNFDDLYYMPDIIQILHIINEKKALKIDYENFELSLLLHDINIKGDLFKLSGTSNKQIKLIYYHNSYKLAFSEDTTFELIIEVQKGLVTPDTIGIYVDKNNLNLSNDLIDSTIYSVPSNIILIQVNKELFIDNIMGVLKEIVLNTLKEY